GRANPASGRSVTFSRARDRRWPRSFLSVGFDFAQSHEVSAGSMNLNVAGFLSPCGVGPRRPLPEGGRSLVDGDEIGAVLGDLQREGKAIVEPPVAAVVNLDLVQTIDVLQIDPCPGVVLFVGVAAVGTAGDAVGEPGAGPRGRVGMDAAERDRLV